MFEEVAEPAVVRILASGRSTGRPADSQSRESDICLTGFIRTCSGSACLSSVSQSQNYLIVHVSHRHLRWERIGVVGLVVSHGSLADRRRAQ
jgi:hypothetical protein